MSMSAYCAQATLNSLFGKSSAFGALATRPTLYVAVVDAAGNEPVGNGYSRAVTSTSSWTAATLADPSEITNAAIVSLGTASATWLSGEPLATFRIYDAASGGNILIEAALAAPQSVLNGDPVSFPIGALVCRLG
jgi:hypothetical protein